MQQASINLTRYRTLRAALLLLALLAAGGAITLLRLPRVPHLELALFLIASALSLVLLPFAKKAAAEGDRARVEHIAMLAIGLGALLLLDRIVSTLYSTPFNETRPDLFRMHYACMPLLFLGAVAVLRARPALTFAWVTYGVLLAVVLPGLYLKTGFDLARPGMVSLLLWLLLANPLFILMLHALPHYEEQLDESRAQMAVMRSQAELMEELREKEQRFTLVVESLEVGVWDRWIGPPERRWWSPRFYELIGYTPGEVEPSEERLKEMLHPDDRERVWRQGTEQLQNGDILDLDFRFNTRHRGYRWFNTHGKAERAADGKLVRLAGSITDIHEQVTAEEALRGAQAELTRMAYRDTLTALYNRRYFDEHFQREWERARRSRQPLALMLIDLDHFKAYNDRYGHPAGDACLVQIGQLLTRCASRPADIVARLGGEEFGVVLPDTTAAGAEEVAQRMQSLLRTAAIPHESAPLRVVTLSAGIAAIEGPEGPGPAEMFEQADKALYEVKRRGRNGILCFRRDLGAPAPQAPLFADREDARRLGN